MKKQKIESTTFPLSGAKYIVERVGQDDRATSDEVVAKAIILLPAHDKYRIAGSLQFGTRVQVCGASLYDSWGTPHDDGYKCETCKFKSDTWAKAFALAQGYAEREIAKLEKALADRAKALIDAEAD